MLTRLLQLLKIQRGEAQKALVFTLLAALLQVGVAAGVSAADSLFLAHIGANKLPVVYIITPFVMMLYIPLYSFLTSRLGVERVLDITLFVLIGGGVGIYTILTRESPPVWVFYVTKLYASVWNIALYTLYWNFADSYFDIQDAKRLFPLFGGGAAVGAILGGGIVSAITGSELTAGQSSVAFLFLLWATLCILTWPVALLVRRRYRKIESDTEEEEEAGGPTGDSGSRIPSLTALAKFVRELRRSAHYVRHSAFARVLLIALFLLVTLTTLNDYQYSNLLAEGRSDRELAVLFGRLYALSNTFSLLLSFFVFNRLVLSVGVGTVAFVAPAALLATFTAYLLDYGQTSALLGFFVYNSIIYAVEFNNWNLLYNAVPSRARRQVRTFFDGLCDPLTTATVGVFLLVGTDYLSPERISSVGILCAAVFLGLVFAVRSQYLSSLVESMRGEALDFSGAFAAAKPQNRSAAALIARHQDSVTADSLRRRARESHDPLEARLAIEALWRNRAHRQEAMEILLRRLATDPPEVTAPLLEMALESDDSEIFRHLIDHLDRRHDDAIRLPARLRETLAAYGLISPQDALVLLEGSDEAEQAIAVTAAWHSGNAEIRQRAQETVTSLLARSDEDEAALLAGIRALSHSRQERHAHTLAELLGRSSSSATRITALDAIRRLVTRESVRLVPALLEVAARADTEEERLLALEVLTRIADAEAVRSLLALTPDFTPHERRQTEAILTAIGLRAVPATVAVLRDEEMPFRARSVAARALAQISPTQLAAVSGALMESELHRVYDALAQHAVLEKELNRRENEAAAPLAGIAVLSRLLAEQRRVGVEFVLELLTLGGLLPAFELVAASLRSADRADRAHAIESIEQAAPRRLFRLLLPLIDGRSVAECLTARPSTPIDEAESATVPRGTAAPAARIVVVGALRSSQPLVAAAAAQALYEEDQGSARASGNAAWSELLRDRLRRATATDSQAGGDSLVRDTILALFVRNTAGATHSAHPTPIETLYALARAPLFAEFTLYDLEVVAREAEPVVFAPGEVLPGDQTTSGLLYVLSSGTVACDTLEQPPAPAQRPYRRCSAGQTVGESSALWGQPHGDVSAPRQAVAETEVHTLRLGAPALRRAAAAHPGIALALLKAGLSRSPQPAAHTTPPAFPSAPPPQSGVRDAEQRRATSTPFAGATVHGG